MRKYIKEYILRIGSFLMVLLCPVVCNADDKIHEDHEMVDLGLSVNWSTCNLGALVLYDCGYCLSWGETEEKVVSFFMDEYKLSKKGKMIVTGIVLNSDKLSIGRNAKKKLRSQIYNYYMGNDKSNGNQISGMLSYLNSIEPNTLESYKQYIEKLRNKLNQKT